MITTFKGKKITGMLTVMPENEYDYDEETKEIATLQTRRLKKSWDLVKEERQRRRQRVLIFVSMV